jgi:phospholipid/cholesterol/gamma-HCH transport system permease protein
VLTLTAVSSVLALIIAYVVVYGLSPWGFDAYTRMVGRVFGPAIALSFAVKSLLFSLAVGVVPIAASMLHESMTDTSKEKIRAARVGLNLAGISESSLVRLFLVIFMIEAATLTIRYF